MDRPLAAPPAIGLLLQALTDHGIRLRVDGDRLQLRPVARVTAELRAELERHKSALIALLEPVDEYVVLKGGLTLPAPALKLAWSLEDRGFHLSLDADDEIVIVPTERLTEADRAGLHRWRLHLAAIIGYTCPPEELPQ